MKAGLPKGTRDFLPLEMRKRQYIFDTITAVYQKYGFEPIETPAIERLDTLMGKYGEEGDQLLFKILNNGDFLSKVDDAFLNAKDSTKALSQLSKRGLRYDLTVPFARYVVMHQNDLTFPFKRYQIQAVWRADRPQKGRYQEFYQCDADIVGSESLMYEADFIRIFDEVFHQLQLPVSIQINHRKLLEAFAIQIDAKAEFQKITIAIDKWNKIGKSGVEKNLQKIGLKQAQIDQLFELLELQTIEELQNSLSSPEATEAIADLSRVFEYVNTDSLQNKLVFCPTLARGLSYYTGCIFEVIAEDFDIGSIASGGRYGDLTALFGLKDMSGVGISFGAERIYDVLEEGKLFPVSVAQKPKLLIVTFDENGWKKGYALRNTLLEQGLSVEIYPEAAKMKKQMKYADQKGFVYVGILGDREIENDSIALKHMESGQQEQVAINELAAKIA